MNQGKYIFTQITSFLPQRVFDRIVKNYDGNYRVRHFTCWNQMMAMMFGQLSNRDSLRDLVLTINAHPSKLYHMGFGKSISKSNLALANEQRPFEIYEAFAYHLIGEAQKTCLNIDIEFSFSDAVYAFDTTTIDLCLNTFCWATFRKAKGALKTLESYTVGNFIPGNQTPSNGAAGAAVMMSGGFTLAEGTKLMLQSNSLVSAVKAASSPTGMLKSTGNLIIEIKNKTIEGINSLSNPKSFY